MVNSPFGFDKPEDSPGFLLWQTTVIWQRKIKKVLEAYDLSHAQFVLMAILLWFSENPVDELPNQVFLVKQSKLDKMTVSQALKKLSSEALIERQEHQADTRAKSVVLTKKGKKLITKLVPLIENIDAEFFNKIQKKEQRALINTLNDLIQKENQ